MENNRPKGRRTTTVAGGGNAGRRGGGLGTGPVGNSRRPSSSSSGGSPIYDSDNRATGRSSPTGGLIAVLIALLLGRNASGGGSGGSNGGTGKKSCLSRIIVLVLIIVAVVFIVNFCSNNGLLPGMSGYTDESDPYGSGSVSGGDTAGGDTTDSTLDYGALFAGLGTSTAAVSSSDPAYGAHEADYTVASAAREKRTKIVGNGADTVTIMMFMCGSDLETGNGFASIDLQEMVDAKLSDNVNLIVETGGSLKWKNNVVSAQTNQIYQIVNGGLKALDKNVGNKSMTEPATLSDFIRYCKAKFPADRYALIFWDHGGGSISGYGYDEHFPKGSMTLDEIDVALKDGGCTFDFIGFDACLMGSLEMAIVAEQYADYFIASEAVEPGTGWYYTDWLSKLSQNASMSTVDIGKAIIDDYVTKSQQSGANAYATLSLIDLAELSATLPATFTRFSQGTSELISSDGYDQVAVARSKAKDFSSGSKINQIDLIHFAENLGTDEGRALAEVLRGCIKYNRASSNVTHANGLSIFFPYNSLKSVSAAINTYEKVGLDESYTECIRSFASMAAGGSVVSGGSDNPLGTLLGDQAGSLLGSMLGADMSSMSSSDDSSAMITSLLSAFLDGGDRSIVTGDADNSWIDEELLNDSIPYFSENAGGFYNMALSYNDAGQRVLSLTEDQWDLVRSLELNVFIDDGSGYIDLGLDNVFDWDADGNLLMEYDGTWLSLNGQIVSYYFISQEQIDDALIITGYVPAMLNGQRVNIILVFDDAHPSGRVAGAQIDYEGATDTVMKGLLEIAAGDEIDFLCDFYTYDGVYSDSYYLGERMIATGEWVIGNAPIGSSHTRMTYCLTDIYGAQYWTPPVS